VVADDRAREPAASAGLRGSYMPGHRQELVHLDRATRCVEVRVVLEQLDDIGFRARFENRKTGELVVGLAVPAALPSPSGAPRSTIAPPALPAHAIHASIPALVCSAVALAICSRADRCAVQNKELRHLYSFFRGPRVHDVREFSHRGFSRV
jgi:hypothetical protein